jgi:outer membrane protein
LQQRLEKELANEQQKFLQALQDSLDHFLADYNKTKKYDMIVNKAAVLYADNRFDITSEVVNGMNKRYNKDAAPADTTKTK